MILTLTLGLVAIYASAQITADGDRPGASPPAGGSAATDRPGDLAPETATPAPKLAAPAALPDRSGHRGTVALLVDAHHAGPLAYEVGRLELDLAGDGWAVVRREVARLLRPPEVKAIIQEIARERGDDLKAVFLLGRIAVPYSGDLIADGHPDHQGAWPADAYYGDLDGEWTDATVNRNTAWRAQNRNVPGDGKFDPSELPSIVELMVGRVDFANLPAFNRSERELLRRYLDRNHHYRHGQLDVPLRALTTAPAHNAAKECDLLFGAAAGPGAGGAKVVDKAAFLPALAAPLESGAGFAVAQQRGKGSYDAAFDVGRTRQWAALGANATVISLFGSYFADWDSNDNLLRAAIASHGLGLASYWGNWELRPLASGDPIGAAALYAQNHLPRLGPGDGDTYVALMGDPTLRLYPVKPPSRLRWETADMLAWEPSPDPAVSGYHVFSTAALDAPLERLTPAGRPVAATRLAGLERQPRTAYLVAAVAPRTTGAGTFLNPSQAIYTRVPSPPAEKVPEGLVAHWRFRGDTAGAAGADNAPMSLHRGARLGDGDSHLPGASKGYGRGFPVLALDGGGAYASAPAPAALTEGASASGDLTVCAWVYRGDQRTRGGAAVAQAGGFALDLDAQNRPRAAVFAGGGQVRDATGPNPLGARRYYHLGLTYERRSGQLTLYLDGARNGRSNAGPRGAGEGSVFAGAAPPMAGTGGGGGIPGNAWTGRIYDLRIYGRTLAPEEMAALARGGDPVDFRDHAVSTYGGYDPQNFDNRPGARLAVDGEFHTPTAHEVLDDGLTIRLAGNAAKKVNLPYRVTPDTRLEFEYRNGPGAGGRFHGIGLDEDHFLLNGARLFKLHGSGPLWSAAKCEDPLAYRRGDRTTEAPFLQAEETYRPAEPGGWVRYSIPIGRHYTGQMHFLVLAALDETGGRQRPSGYTRPGAEAVFRNVRVVEE